MKEKKNISQEWRRKREMERRRDSYSKEKELSYTERKLEKRKMGKKEKRIISFLESNSSVVRRKEGRREASVSVIPGFNL